MVTKGSDSNSGSTKRPILLAVLVMVLAVAIGYALGVPFPVLSGVFEKNKGNGSGAAESRTAFVSESWYRGANEYLKAKADQQDLRVPLIVYFFTDWCSYCKKFDRDILTSSEVSQFMNSVIKIRINPEAGPDEAALASKYGVTGYPAIFVVDAETGTPRKVYPFKQVGGTFVAVEPAEFVAACR